MALFDLFNGGGSKQESPAPSGQESNNQQQPQGNNGNPKEPAFQQSQNTNPKEVDQTTENQDQSSLDQFKDLFDDKPKEGEEPAEDTSNDDFFSYDPEKLQQSVAKMNFANGENFQEMAGKALQGDTDAFMQVLNAVGQQVYSQAAQLSVGVANRTAKESFNRSTETLPASVRSLLAKENVSGLKKQYQHPAVKPMVSKLQEQIEKKFPDASPKEISDMVNTYMDSFTKEMSSNDDSDPTSRPNKDSSNSQPNYADIFNLG